MLLNKKTQGQNDPEFERGGTYDRIKSVIGRIGKIGVVCSYLI